MVKAAPGAQWAWLMLDSQGSRLDFWNGQGVKLKNLMGQDLDPGRGWKYRCLCSVTPLFPYLEGPKLGTRIVLDELRYTPLSPLNITFGCLGIQAV